MAYNYKWKPSKSSKVEFAKKMEAIDKLFYQLIKGALYDSVLCVLFIKKFIEKE